MFGLQLQVFCRYFIPSSFVQGDHFHFLKILLSFQKLIISKGSIPVDILAAGGSYESLVDKFALRKNDGKEQQRVAAVGVNIALDKIISLIWQHKKVNL